MIPFCWSKGGGSQESERELVVTRGTVRLVGAAVGTAEGREEEEVRVGEREERGEGERRGEREERGEGGRGRRREGRKEGEGEREGRGEMEEEREGGGRGRRRGGRPYLLIECIHTRYLGTRVNAG